MSFLQYSVSGSLLHIWSLIFYVLYGPVNYYGRYSVDHGRSKSCVLTQSVSVALKKGLKVRIG